MIKALSNISMSTEEHAQSPFNNPRVAHKGGALSGRRDAAEKQRETQ